MIFETLGASMGYGRSRMTTLHDHAVRIAERFALLLCANGGESEQIYASCHFIGRTAHNQLRGRIVLEAERVFAQFNRFQFGQP